MQDKEYKRIWQELREHKTQQYLEIARYLRKHKNLDEKEVAYQFYKLGGLDADLSYMDKLDQTDDFKNHVKYELEELRWFLKLHEQVTLYGNINR